MLNGRLEIDQTTMDYIVFGKGKKNLIMIPGVGDGLRSVKGMAFPFSLMYHAYTKEYTVYIFSRKNKLEKGYSTKDMASDLKKAMDILKIEHADIIGVSQGGMIAEHLAIHYPQLVNKLVLVVSAARNNTQIQESLTYWIDLVKQDKYQELMNDNVYKMYSKEYYNKNKWMIPLVSKFTKPKSFERFIIMAQACIEHECYDDLNKIQSPTLVIGGRKDQVVGCEASIEIANQIKDCECHIYEEYGHALYEEAKDFNKVVLTFLKED